MTADVLAQETYPGAPKIAKTHRRSLLQASSQKRYQTGVRGRSQHYLHSNTACACCSRVTKEQRIGPRRTSYIVSAKTPGGPKENTWSNSTTSEIWIACAGKSPSQCDNQAGASGKSILPHVQNNTNANRVHRHMQEREYHKHNYVHKPQQ